MEGSSGRERTKTRPDWKPRQRSQVDSGRLESRTRKRWRKGQSRRERTEKSDLKAMAEEPKRTGKDCKAGLGSDGGSTAWTRKDRRAGLGKLDGRVEWPGKDEEPDLGA